MNHFPFIARTKSGNHILVLDEQAKTNILEITDEYQVIVTEEFFSNFLSHKQIQAGSELCRLLNNTYKEALNKGKELKDAEWVSRLEYPDNTGK